MLKATSAVSEQGQKKGGQMSKIETEGNPADREQKEPVDIADISSLTAAKLFELAAQFEVRSTEQITPSQYAGSYPRFE
jgi:hypothetical protein